MRKSKGTDTLAKFTISGGTVGPSRRRLGKELLEELGTAREKEAIVLDMAKARGDVHARLLAVGIFLSVLTVTPRQVMDTMRKVWKMRGALDINPLEGIRFVLEFAEEGDFNHVTEGGLWRFREDAVLIEALKEGEDPETVPISTVPIWAQFRNIPFYLLSKELARDLGKKIGSFICIDNDSRGDICDKIIRARSWVDINQPLLRWTPLLDEITNEVVIVSICYERLPKFYLACGIIGHGEDACSLPAPERKNMYGKDLGVPPTHVKDPRHWFLPETTGNPQHPSTPAFQWRVQATPARLAAAENDRQLAAVNHVTEEVGRLSVHAPLRVNKDDTDHQVGATSPSASVVSTQLPPGEKAMEAAPDITLPLKKGEPSWRRKV
ncbi:hypothetical protein ACQ4PT_012273 [Festuca glaucescens]